MWPEGIGGEKSPRFQKVAGRNGDRGGDASMPSRFGTRPSARAGGGNRKATPGRCERSCRNGGAGRRNRGRRGHDGAFLTMHRRAERDAGPEATTTGPTPSGGGAGAETGLPDRPTATAGAIPATRGERRDRARVRPARGRRPPERTAHAARAADGRDDALPGDDEADGDRGIGSDAGPLFSFACIPAPSAFARSPWDARRPCLRSSRACRTTCFGTNGTNGMNAAPAGCLPTSRDAIAMQRRHRLRATALPRQPRAR